MLQSSLGQKRAHPGRWILACVAAPIHGELGQTLERQERNLKLINLVHGPNAFGLELPDRDLEEVLVDVAQCREQDVASTLHEQASLHDPVRRERLDRCLEEKEGSVKDHSPIRGRGRVESDAKRLDQAQREVVPVRFELMAGSWH